MDRCPVVLRFAGAIMGLFGGALFGVLILVSGIVLTGSYFGLGNVWPGALTGAFVGFVIGFCFPKAGMTLLRLYS
jgi:hypothetical protein